MSTAVIGICFSRWMLIILGFVIGFGIFTMISESYFSIQATKNEAKYFRGTVFRKFDGQKHKPIPKLFYKHPKK